MHDDVSDIRKSAASFTVELHSWLDDQVTTLEFSQVMRGWAAGARRVLNPFTPEFLQITLPSLNLDTSIVANRGFSQNLKWNDKQCIS